MDCTVNCVQVAYKCDAFCARNELRCAYFALKVTFCYRSSTINQVMVVSELDKVLVCFLAWWNIKMFSVQIGRSGDRIPLWARLSLPVLTDPGAPNFLYSRCRLSFLGIKRPGSGFDHSSPSSTEVKERVELYLYSTSGPSWPVLGELYLYLFLSW